MEKIRAFVFMFVFGETGGGRVEETSYRAVVAKCQTSTTSSTCIRITQSTLEDPDYWLSPSLLPQSLLETMDLCS